MDTVKATTENTLRQPPAPAQAGEQTLEQGALPGHSPAALRGGRDTAAGRPRWTYSKFMTEEISLSE